MQSLKKYFKNRWSLYFYINKCIRNPDVRHILFLVVRIFIPKPIDNNLKNKNITPLKKDGIITWEQLLDPVKVNKIHSYLLTKPVYDLRECDNGKGQLPVNLYDIKITRQTKLKYFDADLANCQEIVEVANAPEIISLVSAYLGGKPTISLMSAWWTKAGDGPAEFFYDDNFHRDVADYKFLKLFVYLTDVTADNGAHCFIKRSHLSKKCTQRRMYLTDEIDKNFDKNDQLVLTGKSGCGFLEDTWGLHRSMPCTSGERLVLHILYNLITLDAGSPEKPLAKNIYNVDTYSNRVYLYP